ncbi:MAG TPA: amidohydrolase, partial [Cyclobacteriaceae bacterium]|nr:amidohydrolase [Cyclobacteriaceae bacterium]
EIAESAGATADVNILVMYPATVNHESLTHKMVPALVRAAGQQNVVVTQPVTMAEDFSFYQREVPGFFFFLGAYPAQMNLTSQPTHHTADFMLDEAGMITGVKALVNLTLDYMESAKQ